METSRYISGDAHRHELIIDFQWMYCTVCLFLPWALFEIRNEKQSETALLLLPHKATSEDPERDPTNPPKGTPKPSSGPLEDSPRRPPKPVTLKNHFLRWKPPGGFAVPLSRALEMGPQLYIDTYILI